MDSIVSQLDQFNQTNQTAQAHALDTGAVLLSRDSAGVLVLTDADRVDFLQRMTSNNIARLTPGSAVVTVLTSPTARIVYVFTVLCREDALLLLPAPAVNADDSPNGAALLGKHLRGQIFFMDKVRVQDASADFARLRVVGAQAQDVVRASGINLPAQDDQWLESDGIIALVQSRIDPRRIDLPGVELLIPAAEAEQVIARLTAQGAVHFVNEADYTARRIALGIPAVGRELTGDYNPLEAGMAWACADNKGCYTGQEIIARQQTYEKVTKSLVGIRSSSPLPEGASLSAEGRDAGRITSAAYSPALQAWIALGVVKRPWNEPGARLVVANVAADAVAADAVAAKGGAEGDVVALPFVS